MQKHRFISRTTKTNRSRTILMLAAAVSMAAIIAVIVPSPSLASGTLGSTSDAERQGCLGTGYDQGNGGTWALRYNGSAYQNIGYVHIRTRVSPSNPDNVRVCAVTWHGTTTWGKSLVTSIEVGSEPKGNGTQDMYFYDRANYTRYTEGRAITPGAGRCAVIHAYIKYNLKTYQVWVDQNDVPDSWFCN